jgi:mono/diheme cytochrome c family protein
MALSLFIRSVFPASALALCVALAPGLQRAMSGPGQSSPRVKPAAAPAPTERLSFAAQYFRRSCARCHSEDFTGSDGRDLSPQIPDFTSATWQASRSDVQLLVSILDGKGRRMPAYHGRLDRDKARALVAYVRQAGPQRMAAPAVADDFDRRFAELRQQLEELCERYRRLADAVEKREAGGADKPAP